MLTLRTAPCLWILPLCLAGCASTTGVVSSKMKTVASVGDKQLPVVTGEPGASVVAGTMPPERPKRSDGRISGRVYDENGDPLPDVRVRLAVGNTPGGKLISSTTDRTGAFTLPGLRVGSDYTVIAELEDGQEYRAGRSVVQAPDTDVRITLGPEVAEGERTQAAAPSKRVRPISEQEPILDDEGEGEAPIPRISAAKPRVNVEDLPPAPEADELERPARTRPPATPPRGVRWRPVGADGGTQKPKESEAEFNREARSAAPQDPEAREAAAIASNAPEDDEGVNPLPPALEPVESSGPSENLGPLPPAREPGQMKVSAPAPAEEPLSEPVAPSEPALSEENPLPPAREPSPRQREEAPAPDPALPPPTELEPERESAPGMTSDASQLPPVAEATDAAALAAASAPIEPTIVDAQAGAVAGGTELAQAEPPPGFPGELPPTVEADPSGMPAPDPTATPATSAPEQQGLAQSSPFEASPFETSPFESSPFDSPPAEPAPPKHGSAPALAEADDQSIFEMGAEEPTGAEKAKPAAPPETRKRPTWKDLATLAPKAGGAPGGFAREASISNSGPTAARESVTTQTAARAGPPARTQADGGELEFCDYDARHRKINDFRLPDLQGRPVRFQDLEADLILIDFWGTWCQPCLQSVPHLVELQKRMGTKRLQIVGIACEQGPTADRAKKVAEEVRRLGINYPVLISEMDGPGPLQDALKVQAYPTLILVDRQGRIVWRDQGATPITLARLDRFLASAAKSDAVRRY